MNRWKNSMASARERGSGLYQSLAGHLTGSGRRKLKGKMLLGKAHTRKRLGRLTSFRSGKCLSDRLSRWKKKRKP